MSDQNDLHKQPLITDDGELRIASPVANASARPFAKPKKAKTSDRRSPFFRSVWFWVIALSFPLALYSPLFLGFQYFEQTLCFTLPLSPTIGIMGMAFSWDQKRHAAYGFLVGMIIAIVLIPPLFFMAIFLTID